MAVDGAMMNDDGGGTKASLVFFNVLTPVSAVSCHCPYPKIYGKNVRQITMKHVVYR